METYVTFILKLFYFKSQKYSAYEDIIRNLIVSPYSNLVTFDNIHAIRLLVNIRNGIHRYHIGPPITILGYYDNR